MRRNKKITNFKPCRIPTQPSVPRMPRKKAPPDPDFSEATLVSLCGGINLILDELKKRGCAVRDFDHKEKIAEKVVIVGRRVYMLSAPEESNEA